MKLKWTNPIPVWPRIVTVVLLVTVTCFLVAAQFSVVESTNIPTTARIAELEDNEQTLNLAVEFGFDPIIVQITRQLAAQEFQKRYCTCKTWRFVRTDDDLAYLLLSLIQIESRGDYRAINTTGPAYGLTQFIMSTARQYDKGITQVELLTIPRHMELATQHFVDLLEQAGGNHMLAVAAWNQGSGVIRRAEALGSYPGNMYANTVLTRSLMRNAQ